MSDVFAFVPPALPDLKEFPDSVFRRVVEAYAQIAAQAEREAFALMAENLDNATRRLRFRANTEGIRTELRDSTDKLGLVVLYGRRLLQAFEEA